MRPTFIFYPPFRPSLIVVNKISLEQVESSYRQKDLGFVWQLIEMIHQPPDPDQKPLREGVTTFSQFVQTTQQPAFFRQPVELQKQKRMDWIASLEADDNVSELPPHTMAYRLIYQLWQNSSTPDYSPFDRRSLLLLIKNIPLVYGPWKALKKIFKESEANGDLEIYAALAVRFDEAFSDRHHQISQRTLGYLVRRAWRYLRNIGLSFPAAYPDAATEFLLNYQKAGRDSTRESWIFNQILHRKKKYGRTRFQSFYTSRPQIWLKERAFPELWKRSPRPLLDLLQRAEDQRVQEFAALALKTDFRTSIGEFEVDWTVRMMGHWDPVVHNFVCWVLENSPKFEQSRYRELGIHDEVLCLLDSPAVATREFAAQYVRTHARDLDVSILTRLANNSNQKVHAVAMDLLGQFDPREEIGLEVWGQLLETTHGHAAAADALIKNFGASELTPAWFQTRLLSHLPQVVEFAIQKLPAVHPAKTLGPQFFLDVIQESGPNSNPEAIQFAARQLESLDLNELETERLEALVLHPAIRWSVLQWVNAGLINPNRFSLDFLKSICFHPTFDSCSQVQSAMTTHWGQHLSYDPALAESILGWLADVRQFTPDQLGFDWLMTLVRRNEPRYHEFATQYMTRAFLPADFAMQQNESGQQKSGSKDSQSDASKESTSIDFESASFVFTGKLATMTRSEAQKKVTTANGTNAKSVTKKLDYLVIGDEGSPMYGQGRKGSKQVKAESLNEQGAGIRVISETAFLQMLTGTQREFSDDAIEHGCEALWSMLFDDGPLGRFAYNYLRHHHPDICLQETDRPVDPGSEVPESFLTFERVFSLFSDPRPRLRELALEYSKLEFAKWAPRPDRLIELCELPYPDIRKFIGNAMLAEPTPENQKWRLDQDSFEAEEVYKFCQSSNSDARKIGIKLIDANPRLREPKSLFSLTESPDRAVRAFVVRTFWSLYRERFVTRDWRPGRHLGEPPDREQSQSSATPKHGVGPPRKPDSLPAGMDSMQFLLRRLLFEIPPGRRPRNRQASSEQQFELQPLPTRKSKLMMVETVRDLAIEDSEFASVTYPILLEFMGSHGKSEHDTCLVATTRIRKAHPELIEALSTEGADA